MPKKGENTLKFDNFQKQLPVPFVIYADFEKNIYADFENNLCRF